MQNNNFSLELKKFVNVYPEKIDLTNLFSLLEKDHVKENSWGSVFVGYNNNECRICDFNLVREKETNRQILNLYFVENDEPLDNGFVSYYVFQKEDFLKNRKYKNINKSEYLEIKNE